MPVAMKTTQQLNVRTKPSTVVFLKQVAALSGVSQQRIVEAATAARWPRALPYLALALFCGIRPDELGRMTPADVHVGRRVVMVSAAASKVRQRRIISMPDAAAAWLELPGGELPFAGIARRRQIRRWRDLLGTWPQDVLRHTAASMMLARDGDVAAVARTLGNSPGILLRHYQELVGVDESAEFWALRPSNQRPHFNVDRLAVASTRALEANVDLNVAEARRRAGGVDVVVALPGRVAREVGA